MSANDSYPQAIIGLFMVEANDGFTNRRQVKEDKSNKKSAPSTVTITVSK